MRKTGSGNWTAGRRCGLGSLAALLAGLCLQACAPGWTKGVSYNPYYYQGIGASISMQGADYSALTDLGLELNGARIRTRTEIITTGGGNRYSQRATDSTSAEVEALLRRGAKIVKRHYSAGMQYSYAVLPRSGVGQEMAWRAWLVKRRSFLPGWAQFSKGQPMRSLFFFVGEVTAVSGYFVFWNLKDDAEFEREHAWGTPAWDFYNRRAGRYRDAKVACIAAAVALYAGNVLDGWNSEPSPGPAYYAWVRPEGVHLTYAWHF